MHPSICQQHLCLDAVAHPTARLMLPTFIHVMIVQMEIVCHEHSLRAHHVLGPSGLIHGQGNNQGNVSNDKMWRLLRLLRRDQTFQDLSVPPVQKCLQGVLCVLSHGKHCVALQAANTPLGEGQHLLQPL